MRIGLIIYGSLNTLSGGFLYDRRLVHYLRSQGDTVEVVSLPWQNYLGCLLQNFSRAAIAQIRKTSVDLWLQDELNHPSLALMNHFLRPQLRMPILSIVHHMRSSEDHPVRTLRLYRQVERTYLRSIDRFIFNSQTTQQSVQSLLGAIVPGLVATPAGDRFGPGMLPVEIERRVGSIGPLRILFVGNLIQRKGLRTLVGALGQLKTENWLLDVVGRTDVEPATTSQIKGLIRSKGLEGRVVLRGNLTEEKLKKAMAESHLLVMVSAYEGFGIAYLEGMGFGLPAVASTGGGAREIIENGKSGWLVPAGDEKKLAETIQLYCQDRKLLLAHSLAARSRFDAFPTWGQTTAKIRDYLLVTLAK